MYSSETKEKQFTFADHVGYFANVFYLLNKVVTLLDQHYQ